MVLLAINTTIVTTGIVVFLIVILILVGILLFAKAKLTAKGDVKISINNGDRIITTEPGSSLLSTLAGQKIFLPSACGGKGSCGMCKCQVDSGAGSILPTETGFFSYKQQHENWRGLSGESERKYRNAYSGIRDGNQKMGMYRSFQPEYFYFPERIRCKIAGR